MNKLLGYIVAVVGLVGAAAYTIPQVKKLIPFVSTLADPILLIVSIALVVIGALIIVRSGGGSSKQAAEVPIYQGKNVVGYRRHKK